MTRAAKRPTPLPVVLDSLSDNRHSGCTRLGYPPEFIEETMVVELVLALAASFLCAALLLPIGVRARRGHGAGEVSPTRIFLFLLILFFATWAGGIWLVPVGPRVWGASWFGFLAVALLVALFMASILRSSGSARASAPPGLADTGGMPGFNIATLLLLMLLLLAIVMGYARTRFRG